MTNTRTRRLLLAAKKLMHRKADRQQPDHGFVCAWVRDRWCGGWFDTYWSVITVASGTARACGRRVRGLPARFEALLLLYKIAGQAPGAMACRAV